MSHDLSALISTRICHDLINPLGAISNGMELLTVIGGQTGPELDLVAESAERATAKLNFFRIAFGNTEHQSDLNSATLHDIIQHMYAVGRFKVVWPQDTPTIRRSDAKLLLLLLLAVESSAPLGGQCTVGINPQMTLALTGPRIMPEPSSWQVATGQGDPAQVSASNVHFAAILETLRSLDLVLTWSQTEDALTVRIT